MSRSSATDSHVSIENQQATGIGPFPASYVPFSLFPNVLFCTSILLFLSALLASPCILTSIASRIPTITFCHFALLRGRHAFLFISGMLDPIPSLQDCIPVMNGLAANPASRGSSTRQKPNIFSRSSFSKVFLLYSSQPSISEQLPL